MCVHKAVSSYILCSYTIATYTVIHIAYNVEDIKILKICVLIGNKLIYSNISKPGTACVMQ